MSLEEIKQRWKSLPHRQAMTFFYPLFGELRKIHFGNAHILNLCTFARFIAISKTENIMRKSIFILLLVSFCTSAFAQGNVRYDIEPAISQIQSDYIANWKKIGEISGYRIQVASFSGVNSKSQAESVKAALTSLFPDTKSYVVYSEPYFRVQIGDYNSRLDAYRELLKIKESYPGAYIVPEKIKYR